MNFYIKSYFTDESSKNENSIISSGGGLLQNEMMMVSPNFFLVMDVVFGEKRVALVCIWRSLSSLSSLSLVVLVLARSRRISLGPLELSLETHFYLIDFFA